MTGGGPGSEKKVITSHSLKDTITLVVYRDRRTDNAASIPSIQQQYLVSTLLVLYKHKIPKRNISFSKGLHASIDKWGYSDDSPMDIDSIMVKEPKDMGPKDIP